MLLNQTVTSEVKLLELKTMECCSMPMVSDWDHGFLLMDFYHSLGSFWVCDNGLMRELVSDDRARKPSNDFVFGDLHRHADAYFAKQLTEYSRSSLPVALNGKVKKSFSSRSMVRQVGISELLQAHPQIGIFESCNRSGHTNGTTQDSYFSKHTVANSLPGARVLAGWNEAYHGGKLSELNKNIKLKAPSSSSKMQRRTVGDGGVPAIARATSLVSNNNDPALPSVSSVDEKDNDHSSPKRPVSLQYTYAVQEASLLSNKTDGKYKKSMRLSTSIIDKLYENNFFQELQEAGHSGKCVDLAIPNFIGEKTKYKSVLNLLDNG